MLDTTLPLDLRQKALDEITAVLQGTKRGKAGEPIPDVLIKAMAECRLREVIRISFPKTDDILTNVSREARETGLSYAYQELVNDQMACWEDRNIAASMVYGASRETATQIRQHLLKETYGA
jgi:hypothetical protein